jgi:hypothetical protein
MTSALHAEGREFNPPLEYFFVEQTSRCNEETDIATGANGVSVTLKLPKL